MNEDFFGIKKDEEPVQDLYAEEQESKNGRSTKHVDGGGGKKVFGRKGGSGMGGNGKILSIAIVLSLLIALACSWFMVQTLGATKSDVNGVITTVNGLSTRVGDVEDTALTPSDLEGLATESFVTGKGYTTVTSVDAKISALNTSLMAAIGGVVVPTPAATGPKITIISGGCNVNVSGSCATYNMTSGKVWSVNSGNQCTLNLTATSSGYGNFTGWSINGLSNTSNPISINITGETFITVLSTGMASPITYTLAINSTAGGTSLFDGTSPFASGSVVPIHAVAETGFVFNGWTPTTGITSPSSANTSVSMTSNRSITANFVSCIPAKPTLTYPDTGNTSVFNGSVHFTWSDCGDGTLYDFYFSTSGSFGDPTLEDLEVSACDWIAPNSNTWYYWKVVATGGCGTKSATGYFRTAP